MLLLIRTISHDYRSNHLHTKWNGFRRTDEAHFRCEDMLLCSRPAGTTVFGRPIWGCPALLVENLLPVHQFLFAQANASIDLLSVLSWKIILQKLPNFLLELQFFSGKISVQCKSPVVPGQNALGYP